MTAPLRGKHVMHRATLRAELREINEHCDGPWEPAIFVDSGAIVAARTGPETIGWYFDLCSARVEHDPNATHDIHLPGDGKPFDVDAVVAKLLIAEVLETP